MNNLYNILMKFIKKSIINLFFLCLLLLYGCAEKKFSELDIVIEARNFFTEHILELISVKYLVFFHKNLSLICYFSS